MFRLDWVEALMKSPYPTVQRYCALLHQLITSHSSLNHDVTSFNHAGHHVLQIPVTSYVWRLILQPRMTSRPTNTCDVSSFNHAGHHVLQILVTSHPSTTQDITSYILQPLLTSHPSTIYDVTSLNHVRRHVTPFNHFWYHILQPYLTSHPNHSWHYII